MTATPARIRRCNRDVVYAVSSSLAVIGARPEAKPTGADGFAVPSMFDNVAHAAILQNERFAILSSNRLNEAAECIEPLRIGVDVPIAPVLPRARMIDKSQGIDRNMVIKGLAIDFNAERNSIEAVG